MPVATLLDNAFLFVSVVGVFGLLVGSFLNVVVYRLPIMMERDWRRDCREFLELPEEPEPAAPFNLAVPASHCPNCSKPVQPWENIPIVSYVLLRGRCSGCAAPISPRYPAVELLSATLSALVAWRFGPGWETLAALFLTWSLICLSLIDFDRQLLPDIITIPLLWLGLALSLTGWFSGCAASILGAMAGYLSLWSVYQGFKLLTGKEGMGFGDFKLLAMLGAWLGWSKLPAIVLMSSLGGAVIGLALIGLRGHNRQVPIPFGPYLSLAGVVALLWGDDINSAYLGWLGIAG